VRTASPESCGNFQPPSDRLFTKSRKSPFKLPGVHPPPVSKSSAGDVIAMRESIPARDYKLAADQNHAAGQANYGWRLANGEGIAKDLSEAARYYKLAADQNHAPSRAMYGCHVACEIGVDANFSEAVGNFRRSADQNDPPVSSITHTVLRRGRVSPAIHPKQSDFTSISQIRDATTLSSDMDPGPNWSLRCR
jgi:hypothetical protein